MLNWYTRITVNLGEIPNFIQHFETEIENSKKEVKIYAYVQKSHKPSVISNTA